MKAFKVELLIIDHDGLNQYGIEDVLHNTRFANDCINPQVMNIVERDIGEWDDNHPLNWRSTFEEEYKRLFG